jgi:hypothetical protein
MSCCSWQRGQLHSPVSAKEHGRQDTIFCSAAFCYLAGKDDTATGRVTALT